jgi:carbon-monoxide dehydrogenase medium subunit
MMGPFEYFEPQNIEEVLSLLIEYGDRAKVIAGGTDLVPMMKQRTVKPEYIISLGLAGLNYVDIGSETGLRIGALTTIRSLEQSRQLQSTYTVISQAASQLGSIAIRNVATVGGNLCNASPSAEMAPPLMALSATIRLVSLVGERIVPLDEFFTGPGTTVLKPDELMTEIQVPAPLPNTAGVYLKHSQRGGEDLAVVGVAAVLTMDSENDVCTIARLILGAVAPTPMRAYNAEAVLKGKQINDKLIKEAAQIASDESRPIDDIRSSAEYRKEMIKVFARDAIRQAAELAKAAS